MKNIIILAVTILLFSCNQSDSKQEELIKKDGATDSAKNNGYHEFRKIIHVLILQF